MHASAFLFGLLRIALISLALILFFYAFLFGYHTHSLAKEWVLLTYVAGTLGLGMLFLAPKQKATVPHLQQKIRFRLCICAWGMMLFCLLGMELYTVDSQLSGFSFNPGLIISESSR